MLRRRYAVVAALLLLLLLVSSTPARMLGLGLLPAGVQLQGLSGTVWRGNAARGIIMVGDGAVFLGRVEWLLHLGSLFTLSPAITLQSQWGDQRLALTVQRQVGGSIYLQDVDANMPASLIKQFVPLALSGRLSVQVAQLELLDRAPVAGSGRLVWQQGAWVSPLGSLPLGSYVLDFNQLRGEPLLGEVLTLSGPVKASGNISLNQHAYSVDVLIGGGDALDPQLEQALSLLAPRADNGYQLQLRGELAY